MDNLKIRPAVRQDIEAIGIIAGDTDLFPPDMLDAMIAGYLSETNQDIWFVGELGAHVVTFGFCEPERMTHRTWNLLAIGVDPTFQGQGCGTQMMTYLEQQLSKTLQRVLIVETMGTPELAKTREFYRKNGYTEEARIREFYEAGADKVVFWKHL